MEALRLSNRPDQVDVQPGRTVKVNVTIPNGALSINALPWANVWLDGQPLNGTTPFANLAVRSIEPVLPPLTEATDGMTRIGVVTDVGRPPPGEERRLMFVQLLALTPMQGADDEGLKSRET